VFYLETIYYSKDYLEYPVYLHINSQRTAEYLKTSVQVYMYL